MGRTMINQRRTSRTFSIPKFLKEYIEKKSNNKSLFVRDILDNYYNLLIEYSEGKGLRDYTKVFISVGMNERQHQELDVAVNLSPHTSACDLARTALWLDYMAEIKLQKAMNKLSVEKDTVRVPIEEGFIDYKIVGEA